MYNLKTPGISPGCLHRFYMIFSSSNTTERGEVDVLWDIYLGEEGVAIGQIIGVNDNMLIAQVANGDTSDIIGIKITPRQPRHN